MAGSLPALSDKGEGMGLYFRPNTMEEAASILAQPGGIILSGGTDFFPTLGDRSVNENIIDISAIVAMKGVTTTSDEHRIGGLTTWTELLASPLPPCFNALQCAAREIGGIQIQNRGTIGGNLCNASPAADSVPCLLALNAQVELISTAAPRRLPLSDFVVGNRKTVRRPDEILSAVIVPRTMDDARSTFLKLGARRYLVISIVMVAAVLKTDGSGRIADASIAVGSCSAVAQRLSALEHVLIGAPARTGIGALVRPEHLSSLTPITDVRAMAGYRMDAGLTLVARALEDCVQSR
jgi:CO/xanthine dehydrogenase FAD-binding subunit